MLSIPKLLKRVQFATGKFFHSHALYVPKNGVPVRAKLPKKYPKKITAVGTTRIGFVTYQDHFGGGMYTGEELRARTLEETPPWSIDKLEIKKLHNAGITGSGEGDEKIAVVILDTGGSPNHEDLQGVYLQDLCKNFAGGNPKDWIDRQSHGTHVAGIVAAQANDIGVRGVAPGVKIVAGKVLNDSGSGSYAGIIEALSWVKDELRPELVKRGFKHVIVNMSLGGPTYDPLNQKVKELVEAGIYVCSAAGNSGDEYPDDDISCPGNAARICDSDCVAAVDEQFVRAYFSSDGAWLTIAAPGVRILSTVPGGYAAYSGTSMASPFIPGVLALSIHAAIKAGTVSKLSPKVIREKIWPATATDKGKPGRDEWYGFGVVHPLKAVDVVKAL